MARGINKVILIGNIGGDPEVRYMPNGNAVTTLSVATSESWKDKETGNKQERTEWHRIVVWGKQAELCSKYLTKGRKAYIEGRLQTRAWDDKDGQKRYTTEIIANTVQFLDSNAGAAAREAEGGANNGGDPFGNPPSFDQGLSGSNGPSTSDDIPF